MGHSRLLCAPPALPLSSRDCEQGQALHCWPAARLPAFSGEQRFLLPLGACGCHGGTLA